MNNRDVLLLNTVSSGFSRGEVLELLWRLNAPSSLPLIVTVLSNFKGALETAEQSVPGILKSEGLDTLPALVQALEPIALALNPAANDKQVRQHSFYFAIARSRASLSREYRMLQALCFMAHARCMKAICTADEYEAGGKELWKKLSWLYQSGLGLRRAGYPESWADEYLTTLNLDQQLHQMASGSRVVVDPGERDSDWVADQIGYIDSLLRKACGLPVRHNPGGSSKGRKLGGVETDDFPANEEDDPNWTEDDQRIEPKQKSNFRDTMAAYRNQVTRSNKLFVNVLENLLPHELALIEVDARGEIERIFALSEIGADDLKSAELRLILLLTLWTGGPDEHRTSLRRASRHSNMPVVRLLPAGSEPQLLHPIRAFATVACALLTGPRRSTSVPGKV